MSWRRIELPKGTSAGSPRLRAVLEGLLEDQLLDEPDTLHFAVQPQVKPSEPLWVAVCDRGWLRSAVQVLEAAERPAAAHRAGVRARRRPDPVRAGRSARRFADAGRQRWGDEPAAFFAGAGAAAVAARGHALRGRARGGGTGGTGAAPPARAAAGAPALAAGGPVRLGPGAIRILQLGPGPGIQETRHGMGRRAGGPAVAGRALGRAAAGGGQSRRTERLGLAREVGAGGKTRSDTPDTDADLPAGEGGGRRAGADGEGSRRRCARPLARLPDATSKRCWARSAPLRRRGALSAASSIRQANCGSRAWPTPPDEVRAVAAALKSQGFAATLQGDTLVHHTGEPRHEPHRNASKPAGKALAPREKMLVGGAAALLAAVLVWLIAIGPALATLRTAEAAASRARHPAAADAQPAGAGPGPAVAAEAGP